MDLNHDDIQIIANLLSPDYIVPAAEQYGSGNPIIGAPQAYAEVRTMVRNYIKKVRKSRGHDTSLALLLRNLGWIPWGFRQVTQIENCTVPRNRMVCTMWPNGTTTNGAVEIDLFNSCCPNATHDEVFRATIITASEMLTNKRINKCVLRNQVYQRHDQNIMIHFQMKDRSLRSAVFNAYGRDDTWVKRKISKALRSALKANKSELKNVADQMLEAWLKVGFITSPAGFMISSAPDVPLGWSALVPNNGISLSLCVNRINKGKCWITLSPDHRAIDGDMCGWIYSTLERRVPELLQGRSYGAT